MTTEFKGLKSARVAGAKRNGEWNRPNKKAMKRLELRIKDWEKCHSNATHEMHKPGSMKVK